MVHKDFWPAYSTFRSKYCLRAEEVSVGIEVSVHTVRAWDMTARGSSDTEHARSPSYFNCVRLARFAEEKGAPKRLVEKLRPEPQEAEEAGA